MHACTHCSGSLWHYSDDPVSIKTALKQAEGGRVDSYLALTDSIIGIIKCYPTNLARLWSSSGDDVVIKDYSEALKKVCMVSLRF